MQYVGNKVFKNRDDLLREPNTWNNCPYNLDKVLALVKKYIFMCNDHNQRICVEHFSMLSGIHKSTISLWANELRRSGDKKAKQIYMMLMDGSMQAADDLMISRTSVTSIAYRNATKERYDAVMNKAEENNVLDMDDLAVALGISDRLKNNTLPDKGKPADEISEVDTDKYPWMAMPDDADLDI